VLHEWKIAEMKTWEGKTLVATLAAYLNALEWKGVHLVTVNDYLAERDAQIMKPLYDFLGVSVWSVSKNVPLEKRRGEYEKDITYVENSELGFDYLRDNLVQSMEQRMLLFRPLNYAIVDEADSILIDEARTPLIISQPSGEPTEKYKFYAEIVKALVPCPEQTKKKKSWLFEEEKEPEPDCDYKIDHKAKTALLTSKGIAKLEKILWVENLYRDLWYEEIHHIENALKALACYHKDKDYMVHNWEVLIIDENTGRAMPWRRYSEGLHQAIEAKEGVEVKQESETVATITYQNFFKLYKKLAGMTWTAATEWEEFEKIYGLEVLVIPTNKPVIRVDKEDKVFFNQDAKFKNIVDTVKFYHKIWVPFLLGTSSVQTSEILSRYLQQVGLIHSVLNAKYHEMEAKIIANAGKLGSIIVATNMAWRGTDIKLEDGLFEKLAENYTKWIFEELNNNKWLSLVVYSEFETTKLLDAIKEKLSGEIYFYSKKEGKKPVDKQQLAKLIWESIKNKIDFTLEADNFYLEAKFNKSKKDPQKDKEKPFVELIIKKSANDEPELVEKDIHMWLYVLASEKHESRRIDNQLRGRSWRQWDPGVSQFYVALDDDLMIKSGGLITKAMAEKLYPKEELNKMALENKMITNSIQRAQKQMEAIMFSIRKNLFEYDSVLNKQREVIYGLRDKILEAKSGTVDKAELEKVVENYIEDLVSDAVEKYRFDKDMLKQYLEELSGIDFSEEIQKYSMKDLKDYIILKFKEVLNQKKEELWEEAFYQYLGGLMLSILDRLWMKHIDDIMYLRDKVSMYGYAQIDPLLQYKKEAFEKYQLFMKNLKNEIVSGILKLDTSKVPTTQVIELKTLDTPEELMNKLKQGSQIAADIAPEVQQQIQQEQSTPKVLESSDDFEVIELPENANLSENQNQSDPEVEEIIKKMLGK